MVVASAMSSPYMSLMKFIGEHSWCLWATPYGCYVRGSTNYDSTLCSLLDKDCVRHKNVEYVPSFCSRLPKMGWCQTCVLALCRRRASSWCKMYGGARCFPLLSA
ncbi:hypothetical protein VNO78_14270 [Psophocarpus tetragonolobus]|uniref:Uncharacterized protein n=1 Tax=Psophocarpus tetragonolobus TaxID=3891 RepID=A0AAN9XQY9_PSOTE